MEVIIDGVRYAPVTEIPEATDKSIQECLEVLTEMRYFNQGHKMKPLAWNAINALAPNLAAMDEESAFNAVRAKEIEGDEE